MRERYTNGFLGAWAKESAVAATLAVQAEASMLSPLKSMKTTTTSTTKLETSLVDIVAVELAWVRENFLQSLDDEAVRLPLYYRLSQRYFRLDSTFTINYRFALMLVLSSFFSSLQ